MGRFLSLSLSAEKGVGKHGEEVKVIRRDRMTISLEREN